MTIPFQEDIVLGTIDPCIPLVGLPQLRLSPKDQGHHAVIWGRTGSGKSRLLESVFLQHLNKGHGVGLIEPHHDLSFDTLTYLVSKGFFKDPQAYDRLVYLDWGNGAFVPFNVLADGSDPYSASNNALSAMLRVWPELENAPMYQTLFLSSAVALIANHLPITFVYQLVVDLPFRKSCLSRVSDPLIHQSFEHFDKLGRDQAQLAGSLMRRAFLLSFSPHTRLTLGQPDNCLPFRHWMDHGTSFIINLGNINDHETRKLVGAMLMVQIEQAALSRTDVPPSQRPPFTLLVDEWASFAAEEKTISTVLSQARKFNLRLWLAAQSLSQISSGRLSGALENCRITIAFGLGRESAEIQSRQIARVDPFAVKEEALTLTQHSQYLSIVEQFESWNQELQNLSPQVAYVKLHDRPPAKIKTLNVPDAKVDLQEMEEVLGTYRARYQRTQAEADEAIASISQPASAPAQPSPGSSSPPAYTTLFRRHQPQSSN